MRRHTLETVEKMWLIAPEALQVLVDQEFVNPEVFKGSVGNLLKSKGAGIEKYVRIEVGQ